MAAFQATPWRHPHKRARGCLFSQPSDHSTPTQPDERGGGSVKQRDGVVHQFENFVEITTKSGHVQAKQNGEQYTASTEAN